MKQATFLFILIVMLVAGFDQGFSKENINNKDILQNIEISDNDLKRISRKTIFFGHQSVGSNMLDALKISKITGSNIKINKISSAGELRKAYLNHMYLGQNYDPFGKVQGFAQIFSDFKDTYPDIAFFKFCYLDINPDTDIVTLFNFYKQTMAEIQKKYPMVVFMHATVPLVQMQTGPKAWIKRLIGKPVTGLSDNVARVKFNELLRAEYSGRAVVFDIAESESTAPDGRREIFTRDGREYYALVPQYSDDGAHLNDQGGRVLAAKLVLSLNAAAEQHTSKWNN